MNSKILKFVKGEIILKYVQYEGQSDEKFLELIENLPAYLNGTHFRPRSLVILDRPRFLINTEIGIFDMIYLGNDEICGEKFFEQKVEDILIYEGKI